MKKNSFIEGTLLAYMAILITKIIGAIYVIPFYKIIGDDGGVLYSYAYNIYNLFLNISTSGIPTAVSIIIAEYNTLKLFNEREKTYNVANKIIALISVISFVIMFVFAGPIASFFINDIEGAHSIESIKLVIRVISFCLLVIPFLSVTRGYLQGNKYVSAPSFSQLIEQFVRIVVVLVGSYIAINVLNTSIPVGVSVALSGTVIGGIAALLFLKIKIKKNKEELNKGVTNIKDANVSDKEIINKIIKYAIPVILISVTQNIYELIDFRFIIKGLYMIGYTGDTGELLASMITTWGPKICMVINAIALGLCTSIIPFIVSSHIKKDNVELNSKFNQAINTILFVGIPLAAFIIIYSNDIYYIFYNYSEYGNVVLKALTIESILFSIQIVMNMILQSMKKYKIVYLNTFAGIIVNTIFDIPWILLLNKIGFYPYLGTLFSSYIGQLTSIIIILIYLKKEFNFSLKSVFDTLFKTIIITCFSSIIVILFKIYLFNNSTYLLTLLYLGIIGIIFVITFLFITYKTKLIDNIFGENAINKVLNKFKKKK